MRRTKVISSSTAALLLALSLTISIPTYAQRGSDDTVSTSTNVKVEDNSGTSVETNSNRQSSKAVNTVATEVHTLQAANTSGNKGLHRSGADIISEMQKNHPKKKTAAERKQTCQVRKQGLQTKFSHIVTNSQRMEDKISSIETKAEAYQQDKNLVPAGDFTTLTTAVATSKADVDTNITALKQVTPSADLCNNESVATDVANFKAAAEKTRDSLKAYRTAVKSVLKALETAKASTSTSTTTEGSTSND